MFLSAAVRDVQRMLFSKSSARTRRSKCGSSGTKNRARTSCFPNQDCAKAFLFLFVQSWRPLRTNYLFGVSDRSAALSPASCVCLSLQNTTDSSSNSSSQKLESSLQPLESSPLPQRHKCMLGHRHDLHDPYRLSDHYFLDQVRRLSLYPVVMPREWRTRCLMRLFF